jgi:hypothetical protein
MVMVTTMLIGSRPIEKDRAMILGAGISEVIYCWKNSVIVL